MRDKPKRRSRLFGSDAERFARKSDPLFFDPGFGMLIRIFY
jgi:hypothetical protein